MWRDRGNNVQYNGRVYRDDDGTTTQDHTVRSVGRAHGVETIYAYVHSCREGAQRAFVCSIP